MFRPVSADHIMFDECIDTFRPSNEPRFTMCEGQTHSYLITSFNLTARWELPHCTIHPSLHVHLPGANSAFISKVDNPETCDARKPHLYGIALSTIVSFITGRACKAPRDDYLGLCTSKSLTEDEICELSMINPTRTAGTGAEKSSIPETTLAKYNHEIAELITKLHSIPYPKYIAVMQAIRLIHLSLINKREDFGLAYLLVVSAIEAISQNAITRKQVAYKHPDEKLWMARATEDKEFAELLATYKNSRGKNEYLKERYIKFVNTFAPAQDWEQIIPHPNQDQLDSIQDPVLREGFKFITNKNIFERFPSDLSNEEIAKIISDSYTHRSCFIHRGEQPPHQTPTSSNRFFEEHLEFNEGSTTARLLPNYELLIGIAQHSIRNWINTIQ